MFLHVIQKLEARDSGDEKTRTEERKIMEQSFLRRRKPKLPFTFFPKE